MIVGQVQNADDKPIFGLYIIGQNWYFVALNGKEYAVSTAYLASDQKSLNKIMQALHWIKKHIDIRVGYSPSV
jgi:hypothetical protein